MLTRGLLKPQALCSCCRREGEGRAKWPYFNKVFAFDSGRKTRTLHLYLSVWNCYSMSTWAAGEVGKTSMLAFIFREKAEGGRDRL